MHSLQSGMAHLGEREHAVVALPHAPCKVVEEGLALVVLLRLHTSTH